MMKENIAVLPKISYLVLLDKDLEQKCYPDNIDHQHLKWNIAQGSVPVMEVGVNELDIGCDAVGMKGDLYSLGAMAHAEVAQVQCFLSNSEETFHQM